MFRRIRNFFTRSGYPRYLRNLLPISQLPVLDIGQRMGSTDYIDFLLPEDLPNAIMKGTDRYQRLFIAIKVMNQEGELGVITIFQREQNLDIWVHGSYNDFANNEIFKGRRTFSTRPGYEDTYLHLVDIIQGNHPKYQIAY